MTEVVAKLFEDHADATLGEFRDVLASALDTCRFDLKIHETVRDLVRADAGVAARAALERRNRGVLVVELDGVALDDPDLAEKIDLDTLYRSPGAELLLAPVDPEKPEGHWKATSRLPEGPEAEKEREAFIGAQRRAALANRDVRVGTLGSYAAYGR